jgi:hypothetical protein
VIRRTIIVAVAAALLGPASALAATKPAVTTGGIADLTPSSVTLKGQVDANGAATTYWFEYGTTQLYGGETAHATVTGTSPKAITAAVAGLAPATRYHYRLVAQNSVGIARGADRAFKTKVQPLGLSLTATPNPIVPGGSTTLVGQLAGTNGGNRQVILQSNAWPYNTGFQNTGNPVVTDASGNFSFPIVSVPVTTQYKVVMPARPDVQSPVVVVLAALQVRTDVKKVKRHRHSVGVRFKGSITPSAAGKQVVIQKNRGGVWTTIASTHAIADGATRSTYSKRVRIRRTGDFRVVVISIDAYATGAGRVIHIKAPR